MAVKMWVFSIISLPSRSATVLATFKIRSYALADKPNLSKERQLKVDSAIKILKLIELAPLLKDAGIF